jgi:quercetin dioxygenase-like cupin family protein
VSGAGRGDALEKASMRFIDHDAQPREIWRPGVETRMLVSASTGAAGLCIFEQWIAPAAGAPPHSHPVEEVLTVLAGEVEIQAGESKIVLGSGQSLIVPAGQVHGFQNIGAATLHMHAVLASPIFEALLVGSTEPVRRWI